MRDLDRVYAPGEVAVRDRQSTVAPVERSYVLVRLNFPAPPGLVVAKNPEPRERIDSLLTLDRARRARRVRRGRARRVAGRAGAPYRRDPVPSRRLGGARPKCVSRRRRGRSAEHARAVRPAHPDRPRSDQDGRLRPRGGRRSRSHVRACGRLCGLVRAQRSTPVAPCP